ncbi:MAG: hypothetical protein WB439_03705 [Acidobacteriaceae bacterium]
MSDIQHHLASIKVDDMDIDVPPSVQQATTLLKENLATATQAVLACEPINATPQDIQSALAKALRANAPEPDNATFPWGGDLQLSVNATSIPNLLEVQLWFAIECGQDTMLLLFAPQQNHWSEKLLWQSPPYKEDSGAFGDFFLTAHLLGASPNDWRLVVAHGKPWCTSRFSSFNIDVLAPNPNGTHPRVIWHIDRNYSRAEFAPTLKASGNVFELRIHADDMLFDPDSGYERTVIYRYRVSGSNVTRLDPIATTGRGFVEEWLSMPWLEAADQSLPTNSEELQLIHHLYETGYLESSNTYTSWNVGAVRSCSASGHFQVAFDSQRDRIVPGKPGGEQDKPIPYFFQIKQIANGYQMESASKTSDPTCTGSDLMSKP